jgi:hypothetical protein
MCAEAATQSKTKFIWSSLFSELHCIALWSSLSRSHLTWNHELPTLDAAVHHEQGQKAEPYGNRTQRFNIWSNKNHFPLNLLFPTVKLALTSPTCGDRSVGIVRLQTKGHGVLVFSFTCNVSLRSPSWLQESYFHRDLTTKIHAALPAFPSCELRV